MKYITDEQEKRQAENFIEKAKEEAHKATCDRAKCGAIIVSSTGDILSRGFNSPPGESEEERRCSLDKRSYDFKVTDKTCCMHAEQRAIISALRTHPNKLNGAKLYFARFRSDGTQQLNGDMDAKHQLYCTLCTKLMYDVGIAEFILPHVKGIGVYTRDEFLKRSYDYSPYSDGGNA